MKKYPNHLFTSGEEGAFRKTVRNREKTKISAKPMLFSFTLKYLISYTHISSSFTIGRIFSNIFIWKKFQKKLNILDQKRSFLTRKS